MDIQEIQDADGQYRCSVCGMITRRRLSVPMFDGTGRFGDREVRVWCRCQEEDDRRQRDRERREADLMEARELRKMSFMDEKLKDASFSSYEISEENQKAHTAAVRYVERFSEMLKTGQGILFFGPVGTGKSYTAAAIANELMNRRRSVVMTSFVKLLNVMSRFSTDDEAYLAMLNRADLLFIDELGAERGTDAALEKVYNVIDSRYRMCKPLILTTNLSMKEISSEADIRYSRIYDRVLEMCYPLEMRGKSLRKREAARRYNEMKKTLEG